MEISSFDYMSGCLGWFTTFNWFVLSMISKPPTPSPKLIAKAPENRWLEYDRCLLGGPAYFSGAMFVSFRECNISREHVRNFHYFREI